MKKTLESLFGLSIDQIDLSDTISLEGKVRAQISSQPQCADSHAKLGAVLTLTQREAEAVECLAPAKDSALFEELGQALTDHYHCREQMAKKLGIDDPHGKVLQAYVRQQTGLQPTDRAGTSLSACLIVKNEAANLERCLASLTGLVDEIVVVDTGSTDGTIEIAEGFGAKIGRHKWNDDFAAARNASLDLATGNWALWIDADETIDPSSAPMVREALMRPQFGGYFVRLVNYMTDEIGADQYVHTAIRLFRLMPGVRFVSRIHEQVLPSLNELGLVTATLGGVFLHHYGYAPTAMQERKKVQRTVSMLRKEVEEFPNDPFHWFNLANAYQVGSEFELSRDSAARATELMPDDAPYGPITYHILMCALCELGQPQEALRYALEAERRGFSGILSEFQRARALAQLGVLPQALASIDRCLEMEWPDGLVGDYGIYSYKRLILKGQILLQAGRHAEALEYVNRGLTVDPKFGFGICLKGFCLASLDRGLEALPYLEASFDDAGEGGRALTYAAGIYAKTDRFDEAQAALERIAQRGCLTVDLLMLWHLVADESGIYDPLLAAYAQIASGPEVGSETLVNYGRALLASGRADSASQVLESAVALNPSDSNAYFNLGDALYSCKAYLEAASKYESGLRLDSASAGAWFALANCMYKLGSLDGAEVGYRQALAIEPSFAAAFSNLESVLADQTAA